jgi:ryanodine receptor 2
VYLTNIFQKLPEYEVVEFARIQLTLPDKLDPADEMSWQHYLYSKLGKKHEQTSYEMNEKVSTADKKGEEKKIEETVERIVAMAKVLYGLHMVCKISMGL